MLRSYSLLLLSIAPTIFAQSIIDYSQIPACAASCDTLTKAQSLCVPPLAPVSNQPTYNTCFCTSNYLNTLASVASSVCNPPCTSAEDQKALQNWFINFCKDPAADAPPPSTASAAQTGTATTTTLGTGTATLGPDSNSATSNAYRSWWDIHARWIAMAIVLILGFGIIIVVGIIWKRKYNQKKNRAGSASGNALWGPNANHINENGESINGGREKFASRAPQPQPKSGGIRIKKLIGR